MWILVYWALHDIYCSQNFPTKLYNELRELRDHFFARHFVRLRYVLPAILGFSTVSYYYKKESLNSDSSYQKDANILMSFAAIVTQLREKWQVYLFAREMFATLRDKVTPLAESCFLIIAPSSLEDSWL